MYAWLVASVASKIPASKQQATQGSAHGIAPGGFESSGTTIPGRRARPHAVLPHLPSDCHRPRAIAGEAASARAQAFARDPSRCRQRQPCARQTVARASLEEILGLLSQETYHPIFWAT